MYYNFPTIDKLTDAKVQGVLEVAKFGYRAKSIQQAAVKIIELGGSGWIRRLCKLPYDEAKIELMQLPGVGAKVGIRYLWILHIDITKYIVEIFCCIFLKVADCICLLSLNHLEAIPVDVHVFRIATTYYLPHLKNMKSVTDRIYKQIGDHFRSLFEKYAGCPHCVSN